MNRVENDIRITLKETRRMYAALPTQLRDRIGLRGLSAPLVGARGLSAPWFLIQWSSAHSKRLQLWKNRAFCSSRDQSCPPRIYRFVTARFTSDQPINYFHKNIQEYRVKEKQEASQKNLFFNNERKSETGLELKREFFVSSKLDSALITTSSDL